MIIAFWSPFSGLGSVSSNLLAVTLSTVVDYKKSCSLTQLAYADNGLFEYFMPKQDGSVGISIFENTGIDALLRNTRGKTATEEEVINSSFSFIERRLNVFTPTRMITEALYVENLMGSLENMMHSLNDVFMLNYVDVPAGDSVYAKMVLPLADVIVVCLPQMDWAMKRYFEQYQIVGPKIVYVFGSYDSRQSLNSFNATLKYQKELGGLYVEGVPYCPGYANACNLGKAIGFYLSNCKCEKQDANHPFIAGVRKTTGSVLKACGLRKELE